MAINWITSKHSDEYLVACVATAVVGEIRPVVSGLLWWKEKHYEIKTSFYTLETGFKIPFGKKCKTIEEAKMYMEDIFADMVRLYNRPKNYGQA